MAAAKYIAERRLSFGGSRFKKLGTKFLSRGDRLSPRLSLPEGRGLDPLPV
jgi:hypothetical protein